LELDNSKLEKILHISRRVKNFNCFSANALCNLLRVIRFAAIRFAVIRFAVIRFAVIRFAVIRFAVIRFAVIRFAVIRFAVIRTMNYNELQ